jgi:hypothetical protein
LAATPESGDPPAWRKEKTMKTLVWLSYDLGLKGDYESLYAWLDNHGARECGDNLAVFSYEVREDLPQELKRDLKKNVTLEKRDRIYIMWSDGRKAKGRFLFGSRKGPRWTGYGSHEAAVDEEA